MKNNKTPICDFLGKYAESDILRLHMPGHKGVGKYAEKFDITEIDGADSLFEAGGIIAESERNAGELFSCKTFYSAEGSSLCIRAMLYLVLLYARQNDKRPLIAAGRNAHRTFLYAAAALEPELQVDFLTGENGAEFLSCRLSSEEIEKNILLNKPAAVYLTSPDYLGNTADIAAAAQVCHKHGVLLLTDNAHGAYLNFLSKSRHPIALGADMCCDSAHKTLPALTGAAYLHISENAPGILAYNAKKAMAFFASTSPSYLILRSLDAANAYLADGYREKLAEFTDKADECRKKLCKAGYVLCGDEPLKITIYAKKRGYYGLEIAKILLEKGIMCEFADPDYLVMMLTPQTGINGLDRLCSILLNVPEKAEITDKAPRIPVCERVMSIRSALLSPGEKVSVACAEGRVLSDASVGCPPAVPIVISGERINGDACRMFEYYDINTVDVILKG